jgi:hypothetical protein
MKKLLLTTTILTSTLFAGNFFSTVSGMTMKQVKPETSYTVDTAGFNPRVYQWETKLGDGTPVTCIALFPNANGDNVSAIPAMQCIKHK